MAHTLIWGSGHRPNKLGGYSEHIQTRLIQLATTALLKYDVKVVISGMALGWDMALANAALNLGIELAAYVPFEGQEKAWPADTQRVYRDILEEATYVEIISTGGYSREKMQIRNKAMVNSGDFGLVLWDGTPGGTANCITYANLKKKPYLNLWASWIKYK
jgi:uncharacterized phage-like protein YoqJ